MRFRRKTFEIEAEHVTKANISEVARWSGGLEITNDQGTFIKLKVTSGKVYARIGDWVIKNPVSGEFYPCDAETFAASYEKVG